VISQIKNLKKVIITDIVVDLYSKIEFLISETDNIIDVNERIIVTTYDTIVNIDCAAEECSNKLFVNKAENNNLQNLLIIYLVRSLHCTK